MAKSLQSAFEEQLADLPRAIATEVVREKLHAAGHGTDEKLLAAIVSELIERTTFSQDEDADDLVGNVTEGDVVIEFSETDADRIKKIADDFLGQLPDLIQEITKSSAKAMLRRYERDWSAWRPSEIAEMNQFRSRLEDRWHKGFDALRMLIELSRDVGTKFHRRACRSRSRRRIHLNSALYHLHVRAIQVASEIMVLLESGYADGAMARWRTLHEVSCVAIILSEGGEALAERYLVHEIVEAKKGLSQYRRFHTQLGYAPFPKRDAARIEREYAAAIIRFGKEFGEDYGWAAAYLGNYKPNFSQIEDAAGRAMMRSHYKMASQNIHAGAKGIAYRLGSLDQRFAAIAGASNVGFVEPGQNLALSLLHITMLLLPRRWSLDTITELTALIQLQERVPRALAQSERAIKRDERKIRDEADARTPKRQHRNSGT